MNFIHSINLRLYKSNTKCVKMVLHIRSKQQGKEPFSGLDCEVQLQMDSLRKEAQRYSPTASSRRIFKKVLDIQDGCL